MSDSVTVESGGLTVTTNTASEADLRAELARDAAPAEGSALPDAPAGDASPATGRDEKGRFLKRDAGPAAAPSAGAQEEPPPDATAEKPGRDPSLPRHNPIARMNQALAQKAEAERKAAALEAELSRIRAGVTSPVTPPGYSPPPQQADTAPPAAGVEPDFTRDFAGNPAYADDPYTHYLQAWARWDNKRQVEARFAAWEAQQAAKVQQTAFEARIREGAQAHPDWQEVLTQADTLGLQVSAVMQAAIIASPRAADLVHYLATHPEECTQLAEESVQDASPDAAKWMRRFLEDRIGRPAAASNGHGSAALPKVSHAQPPVKPVGSSPVGSDAPPGDEASAAEHARYWNRKLKVPGTPR